MPYWNASPPLFLIATALPTLFALSVQILFTQNSVLVYGIPISFELAIREKIGLNTVLIAPASNILLPDFDVYDFHDCILPTESHTNRIGIGSSSLSCLSRKSLMI